MTFSLKGLKTIISQTTNTIQYVEFFHSLIFHLCEDQTVMPILWNFQKLFVLMYMVVHGTLHSRSVAFSALTKRLKLVRTSRNQFGSVSEHDKKGIAWLVAPLLLCTSTREFG